MNSERKSWSTRSAWINRRKLLIWGTGASAVIAVALTVVAAANALTPWTLLAFMFLLGVTPSLTSPAWQAIQPELVPREQIGTSSALGGVTVNGARAVGPALAGIVLSVSGAPAGRENSPTACDVDMLIRISQ